MNKIFLYCVPCPSWGGEHVMGYAIGDNGIGLVSHLSSNVDFSKHDMGLNSDWHHDTYKENYPDGFELEWVDETDPRLIKALEINQELHDARVAQKEGDE